MNKILKYSLVSIMCISIVANLLLLMTVGYVSLDYEDQIYLSTLEWCEYSNDQSYIINELIIELQYYNEDYSEIQLLEGSDCWGHENTTVSGEEQ